MSHRLNLALSSLALALAACQKPEMMNTTKDSTSSSGSSEGMSDTGAASTSTTGPVTSSAGTGSGGGSTMGGFIPTNDMNAPPPMCDLFKQDCPDGQACKPAALDGSGSWNTAVCTPVPANPGHVGDPCTVEGLSGVDSCDEGLLCWYFDMNGNGTCLAMCTGDANNPMCEPGLVCDITNDGVLILCLTVCDPLAASCPKGQICFFSSSSSNFICDFDASGEMGAYGDPCAYINVCDLGLFCAAPEAVPGCISTDGCCSPYCDLTQPNTCPGMAMGQECVPWYTMDPPPGQENIGACAVPM